MFRVRTTNGWVENRSIDVVDSDVDMSACRITEKRNLESFLATVPAVVEAGMFNEHVP